mgnify:CR=1 FL=1
MKTDVKLPAVRGRYSFNIPLSEMTWFQVGGPATVLFKPADIQDLCHFLHQKTNELPYYCLGAGSNILVRDGNWQSVIIRLGRAFAAIEQQNNLLIIGAGCLDRTAALTACQLGLSGLEFLIGIPGSIGGAVAMNAGAYGHEIKDTLTWIEWVNPKGEIQKIPKDDLTMSYRDGNLPPGVIVTRAAFLCEPKDPGAIRTVLDDFLKEREKSQPIRGRTGGSTFKNPPYGEKAWQLIDRAGCRGLTIGDAQVSEKHCNFLLNLGHATAADLETLGQTVQQQVYQKTGILLKWEILRLGNPIDTLPLLRAT